MVSRVLAGRGKNNDDKEDTMDDSVRRVRRGCLGMAAILLALGVMLISATGNLFWSLFGLAAVVLLVLSRTIK
jgi:hypothetical protein